MEERGATAAPSEGLLSALETCVSVTNTPTESPCTLTWRTQSLWDREPLSTAFSLPSEGLGKQSKFVWSLTVYEAHLFTATMASIHPADKGD